MAGAEQGLDLRYDKTSVSRWLRGQRPRGEVPEIIAEVLSSRLGRTVSAEDIGLASGTGTTSWVGLRFASTLDEAIEQARELWHVDADTHHRLARTAATGSALVEASRDWLITTADPVVARTGAPGRRVGMTDVDVVGTVTQALVELDHRFGSGFVRPVVVSYLDSVLAVLINGRYRETTGRRLFAAAARLTELAGYMALDTDQLGLAQRCYVQALRLAQAADDRGLGAYVLAAGMSRLAAAVGRAREAVKLARVAQEGSQGRAPEGAQAVFLMAEARGYAQLGDARRCEMLAGRAAEVMTHARCPGAPDWLAHYDEATLADELAHCYRDLHQPGLTAFRAKEAFLALPHTRVRRRTIDLLLLATAQVHDDNVVEACRTAAQAVALLGKLQSALAEQHLDDFTSQLRLYGDDDAVRGFEALARRNGVQLRDPARGHALALPRQTLGAYE